MILTFEQKTFIVQQLAMYAKPHEIIEACEAEFGIKIDRHTVYNYRPSSWWRPHKPTRVDRCQVETADESQRDRSEALRRAV